MYICRNKNRNKQHFVYSDILSARRSSCPKCFISVSPLNLGILKESNDDYRNRNTL